MPPLDADLVSVDANVAADFAVIGQTDLLGRLFAQRLLISDFVAAELARARIFIDCAHTVSLAGEEVGFFQSLRDQHRNLGLGELGAICVARLRNAIVLTNDKEARRLAIQLQVKVSGTLGVLKHAVATQSLSAAEAIQILSAMLDQGSWFGSDLVQQFKQDLEKFTDNETKAEESGSSD